MRNFWLLVVVLLLPAAASAQQTGVASPQPFRKWDLGGGIGIRFGETPDAVVPAGGWNAELNRYWTAHLKTSFAVMTAGQVDRAYSYDGRVSRQTLSTTGPAAFSAAVGYQFFENVFVHPYVVGGVRMASASNSTQTYLSVPPYGWMSTETQPSRLLARPVVGGGFKSYFGNGRAFMRSELLMAIDPHGSPHAVLHLGAGIDF
jgi:hypothetical protein